HSDVECAGDDCDSLGFWVRVRRHPVPVWKLKPEHEWPFPGRVPFQHSDHGPWWQGRRALLPLHVVSGKQRDFSGSTMSWGLGFATKRLGQGQETDDSEAGNTSTKAHTLLLGRSAEITLLVRGLLPDSVAGRRTER